MGKARSMPPVIPEIAKAYQNDPMTQLALQNMQTGASTAPVARGGWGYADGIARVLQGMAGAYTDKKLLDKYGADEAAKVARMNADGTAGLAANGPPSAPAAAPAVTPAAAASMPAGNASQAPPMNLTGGLDPAAAAAALGAPSAPPAPPQGMAPPPPAPAAGPAMASGTPSAPAMPGGTPPIAPQGAAPGGPVPFGSSPSQAAINAAIGQRPLPDAPAPVARPVAPEAVGPTRSRLLDEAYKLMSTGDRYDYARAQELLDKGNVSQTALDESATERKQRLIDLGYSGDISNANSAAEQERGAGWTARQQTSNNNFSAGQGQLTRSFEGSEKAKDRAATAANEAANRANALKVASLRIGAQYGTQDGNDAINQAMADGRLDPMAVTTRNRASIGSFLAAHPDASPLDIHAYAAGRNSEARATGSRVGQTAVATSELPGLAVEARDAHAALQAQGSLVPWNKAVQAVQSHTSSPQLARAITATDAVAKAYARSFGTGAVAVSHYKDAQAKLQNTWGTPAFEAALNQMVTTTNVERAGATAALDSTGKPGFSRAAPASNGWGAMTVK